MLTDSIQPASATDPPAGEPTNSSFGKRSLRLFSSSILDQVILSATNFLVGFVLIRYASDHDYGLYVLVQSAMLLAVTAHNAYLTGPLSILTPRLPPDERWQTIGSVKLVQRRVLRWIALLLLPIPLIGYLSGFLTGLLALVIAAGVCATWAALRREYLRSVLLMYSRPHTLLRVDAVYAAMLLAGVAAALFVGSGIIVGATCALVVAALAGGAAAHRSLAGAQGWQEGGTVALWPRIRSLGMWSVVGASIYWVLGQSYSYLLASRLDLTAVVDVNATRLILMPAFVLTIGVASLLGPTAANWYVQIGIHGLMKRLMMFLLAVGLLELTYFFIVWIARDWLIVDVMHKHIHDRDRLLLLWAGVVVVSLFRDVLQCALTAMGQLKSLAWLVGVSAAVALLLMWFGVAWWGAPAVLIGQIAGELVNLAGIIYFVRKHMRLAQNA
jgi:O-antigen/teichoic acid export membrane protein